MKVVHHLYILIGHNIGQSENSKNGSRVPLYGLEAKLTTTKD